MSTAADEVIERFDWKDPDYATVFAERIDRLRRIRARPHTLSALKLHYREHIAQFINDWGTTSDPRNALLVPPRPVVLPFILFPKQVEWVEWVLARSRAREPGLTEKSRDCGVSWLAMSVAVSLCLFNRNLTIGVGSAKEDKVDRSGDPDCLFFKARLFLKHLPPDFRGGWDLTRHSAHMRLNFPETQSAIVGEAGDNIGRGGRSSIFFVDEAAHLERPELVDASLSTNTDCRIDISSVSGMANPFARKRHSGKYKTFRFHWRDDPRKDDAWYAAQREILDPVTLAAEIDIDYRGSVEGALIPSAWVQAAIGAHLKLGLQPSGSKYAGLDVADEGRDSNALAGRHGFLLQHLHSWSGKDSDIFKTVVRAFFLCDQYGYETLTYDADGLGAGVRGDANRINQERHDAGGQARQINVEPFRGSGEVHDPTGELMPERKNKDFFANLKAMSWWCLRLRFQATWRALAGLPYMADDLICIDPELEELTPLISELSQPTYSINSVGKIKVDKAPDGTASPNLGDAVMIAFSPIHSAMETWLKLGELAQRE
jgi:hypothetical protein